MDPVFLVDVVNAAVQRRWRQHQDEVLRLSHRVQQVVVKLAGFQPLNVQEDGEVAQGEVDPEQGGQLTAVAASVGDEAVERLADAVGRLRWRHLLCRLYTQGGRSSENVTHSSVCI